MIKTKTTPKMTKRKARVNKGEISRRKIKKIKANKKKKFTKEQNNINIVEFVRFEEGPIILPNPENYWENWQTFNPGVIYLENKVHFIYRAIGEDGVSRFGYAASDDGFLVNERLPYPVFEHLNRSSTSLNLKGCFGGPVFNFYSFNSGGSFSGAEDPRLTRIGKEDNLYMTYTACDSWLGVALTSININDFLNKKWNWKKPKLISAPGEVHKNWVIFPEKINGKYAILHSICPEISIAYRESLDFEENEYIQSFYNGYNGRGANCWDNWIRGAGAPPLKTYLGWLLFYHAMDKSDPGKYKVGAMILDENNPTKILYRAQEPILEPQAEYENNGFKAGVVYTTGAIIKDGKILIYYGASDSYICVASADLISFLETLKKEARPRLRVLPLLKKKKT